MDLPLSTVASPPSRPIPFQISGHILGVRREIIQKKKKKEKKRKSLSGV